MATTKTQKTQKTTDPLEQLQIDMHTQAKTIKDLQRQLKVLETKQRYKPDDADLAAEMDACIEAIADAEAHAEALGEQYRELQDERAQTQAAQERERLEAKSQGYSFDVPDDDPLLGCTMLAAIAQQLQYEFVRSQGPFEGLTAKVYSRGADGSGSGEATGTHADPSYEFNKSDVDKLDQLRERRDYIQTLRFAVAKHFAAMKDKLPEDAPFIPQLYRQSDGERFRQIEERQQQRFVEQQEQRRKAGNAAREFGRQDLNVVT